MPAIGLIHRARVVAVVLVLGAGGVRCGIEPASSVPTPPPPRHDVFLTDDTVLGCYEIIALKWNDGKVRDTPYDSPPQRFRLARILERPQSHTIIPRAPSSFDLTLWRITIDNELEATWSTGLVWLTIAVRQRSTDSLFHGRVTAGSDQGGVPWRGTIELRKISCN